MSASIAPNPTAYTFDELMLEHRQWNEAQSRKFELQVAAHLEMKEKEKNELFKGFASRVIHNILLNLEKSVSVLPIEIYAQTLNKSLCLKLVFESGELEDKEEKIYNTVIQVHKLAVEKENRDFRWSIISDNFLNKDLLKEESNFYLTRTN